MPLRTAAGKVNNPAGEQVLTVEFREDLRRLRQVHIADVESNMLMLQFLRIAIALMGVHLVQHWLASAMPSPAKTDGIRKPLKMTSSVKFGLTPRALGRKLFPAA